MKKLSPIAQEYLDNYEVLRVARDRFDQELTVWWHLLVRSLRDALAGKKNVKDIYDQKTATGNFQVSTLKNKLSVRVLDPNHSQTREYHVLIAGNAPTLKKLGNDLETQQTILTTKGFEDVQLFPSDQALLRIPVEIHGEKPEDTFNAIRENMLKLLDLVDMLEEKF